jgi:hypothetical protein
MTRKILILGAMGAAVMTLAACGPSSGILATAKTGDCFNVTGKDAVGQPKLIHSDCPAGPTSGQSTLPPVSPDQAADSKTSTASTTPPALPATTPVKTDVKAVCQPVAPLCAVPAKAAAAHVVKGSARHARAEVHVIHVSTARYAHTAHAHRVMRTHKVIRHRYGRTYTETVTEYVPASGEVIATIGAPYSANTELSGGSSREETYVLRDHPVYAPPPPPPPPAEARHYDHRSYDSRGADSHSYDSRSYSSSQSYSSSSSASSAQRSAPPPRPCNCAPQRRAPTYEPDGYLTWPNKTEY